MSEHKPGCPALGGYGHGKEACMCGAEPPMTESERSQTPRTDALIKPDEQDMVVLFNEMLDHARLLERELEDEKADRLLDRLGNADGSLLRDLRAALATATQRAEAAEARIRHLESAVRWALGYDEGPPEFDPPENGPRYWWRKELRRRAALANETRSEG